MSENENLFICGNCQTPVDTSMEKCPNCEAVLDFQLENTEVVQEETPQEAEEQNEAKDINEGAGAKTPKNNKTGIIVVLIILVAIIAVGFSSKDTKKTETLSGSNSESSTTTKEAVETTTEIITEATTEKPTVITTTEPTTAPKKKMYGNDYLGFTKKELEAEFGRNYNMDWFDGSVGIYYNSSDITPYVFVFGQTYDYTFEDSSVANYIYCYQDGAEFIKGVEVGDNISVLEDVIGEVIPVYFDEHDGVNSAYVSTSSCNIRVGLDKNNNIDFVRLNS